jgi:hypothetical protein
MTIPKIITQFVNPPIACRAFDYSAVQDDYAPGDAIGYGYTQLDAINDLLWQLGELEPFPGNGAYL